MLNISIRDDSHHDQASPNRYNSIFDKMDYWRFSKKIIFPAALLIVGLGVLLFGGVQFHSFPGMKLYSQHLFFDGIADAGGFYASSFCKHWYHRVPIAIAFALGSTYLLVCLVG